MREEKVQTKENELLKMTTLPVPGLIINIAVSTILSMVVTAAYNTADTYFVSRLGTSAAGAVGVVFSIMALLQAVGFTFGTGAASIISRKLGANDIATAGRLASTSFFLALFSGTLFTIFGLFYLDFFMLKIGATETILPYAKEYARYILLGAPIICSSFVMNNILRAEGKSSLAMFGLAAGAILNIILDPIFIFTFKMGISGAAIATLLSQAISFMLLLSFFTNKKSNLRIKMTHISKVPREYWDILMLGAPSLFRQGFASIAAVALNVAAAFYGDAAIAAMSIVSRVFMFALSIIVGLGHGFMPVVGFNYGAQNYNRVKEAFLFTVKVGFSLSVFMMITGYILSPRIMALFKLNDVEVLKIGTYAMRAQFLALILQPLFISTNMLLQSTGHAIRATFLSSIRQGLYFLPAIYILSHIYGLRGIELTQPIADIFAFFTSLPFLYCFWRSLNREIVAKR